MNVCATCGHYEADHWRRDADLRMQRADCQRPGCECGGYLPPEAS